MKNRVAERSAIAERREVLEDSAGPAPSSRSSSSDGGRKLRFTKLWVCTRGSNSRGPKIVESTPRRDRPSDLLAGLEDIDKTGSVSTEQKSSQTYFDCNSTIDASTETTGRATADAAVSCRCETLDTSSGPDEFIEIRCVDPSRSSAVQTDACAESAIASGAESGRFGRRSRPIFGAGSPAASPEELLEASEDAGADLIYDGTRRCFPYPIELTGKPKYVATCESCESSTDKWVSIAHGGLDAAVGSSIIIDASQEEADRRRPFVDRRSVSCEVCDDCPTPNGETRSRARESLDETRRSSRDESGSRSNRRRTRERESRDTSVGDESAGSADEDFAEESSIATREDTGRSADRRGSRPARGYPGSSSGGKRSGRSGIYDESRLRDESSSFWIEEDVDDTGGFADRRGSRSARGHEGSSSGGKRSGRSRIYDENRQSDESSRFWNESSRSWLDDHEERESTSVPLHESTRLSLRSLETRDRNPRGIDRAIGAGLIATSTRSKKPYSLPGVETSVRIEDFDDVTPRRRKARTSENLRNRELAAAISALDEKEPLFRCKRDEPFVFALRKFTKPKGNLQSVTNEFRQLASGTCRISEFNNFGERYDWDRALDPASRRKYCKCGNGCGGLKSAKKCCCDE